MNEDREKIDKRYHRERERNKERSRGNEILNQLKYIIYFFLFKEGKRSN